MAAVIEVQHLHKRYGDTVAVRDVSFTVHEDEIFGILGPNGAGKTTTVECIEGLREPDGGEISVLGLDPLRDRAELTRQLGVQLQESRLPDQLRVAEGWPRPDSSAGSRFRSGGDQMSKLGSRYRLETWRQGAPGRWRRLR